MKAITHKIKHHYQPTASSCGYTALATLLSYYGVQEKPEDLMISVPQPINEHGHPFGSITAQLATWVVTHDFRVNLISFDFQITDLSWADLDSKRLIKKFEQVKGIREIACLGDKIWSKIYIQSYIDFLKAGGHLTIKPHVTTRLLYDMLKNGPVYANICSYVTHNVGRQRYPDDSKREHVADDIHGTVGTHSIVIYGNDGNGNFLVSDPWHGLEVTDPETMLCAITAAELECDSQCFQMNRIDFLGKDGADRNQK